MVGRRGRVAVVAAAAVLVCAGLVACSPGRPDPREVADQLAAGLAAGDLGDVPLADDAGDPTPAVADTVAGLEPLRPAVVVDDVVVDEDDADSATATLTHTWDVDAGGDADWTYTTRARIVWQDEAWAVRWSPAVVAPDLAADERLVTRRAAAERADVLGAGDAVLVTRRPVLRLGLDKTRVEPAAHPDAARAVAALLGLDPEGYATRVASAGEKAFVEALVVRVGSPDVDLDAFRALDGALAVEDALPLAPTRSFARAVLGTAGPATQEVVEESGGAVVAGDVAGLSGLQRQYDEQLRGRPGVTVLAVRGEGGSERVLHQHDPVPGEPLRTTIDPDVQQHAEEVLAGVGPASGIAVVRPSTGEVLAVASGPGSEGLSTATLGTYAPGSVFKVVTALAAVRAGHGPDSPVQCPTELPVEGRTFRNFPDYPAAATGVVPLRTAMAHSCNTAFIGLRADVPAQALADAAASLGLVPGTDVGAPAFLGSVPTDSTGTDHAAAMIGQGRVQMSPLAMATVVASVGRGGTVRPWLVGDAAPQGPEPDRPLTAEETTALRDLMRGVVTDGGATFLADVPGEPVHAKTGTAQYDADGETRNHAWMVAMQGDLAVAVLVADGEYGSTTAGPLLEDLLRRLAG